MKVTDYAINNTSILRKFKLNLVDYGFIPTMVSEDITELQHALQQYTERGMSLFVNMDMLGRLKTSVYYDGLEDFPTTGDFVMVNYNLNGDSQIIKTLIENHSFPGVTPHLEGGTGSCCKL